MYLLNRGYSLKVNENLDVNGIILSASGMMMPQIERREIPNADLLLFDPQLYFPIEYNKNCSNTFSKLTTYPWYNQNPPTFNSTKINIKDFMKEVKEKHIHRSVSMTTDCDEIRERIKLCIDFQNNLGTSYIILPVPLVVDAEDQYSTQLTWINEGINIASQYSKPILVTVAISDIVIIHKSFEENTLLQTILDNLTALEDIDGFYVVISRSNNNTNIIEKNIVQTVLEISYLLGNKINKKVFLNFMDNLGFLGLACGAYAFGSGYTNKERRLNFNDYHDKDSGGAPLPHFYSYSLIGDFFPERDLKKIRDARLLRYIENDVTDYSVSLYNALYNGSEISKLADWKETLNNISIAKNHRTALMIKKINYLNSLSFADKIRYTLEWLQNAEATKHYFDNLFEDDPMSEDGKHIPVWRKCFQQFITKYNLI